MSTRSELIRLAYSNDKLPTSAKPSLRSQTLRPRSSGIVSEIESNLRELLELKPAQVGGIAVIVEHALGRARSEHPAAAAQYSKQINRSPT